MTKLTEWLFGGVLFVSAWLALIMDKTPIKMTDDIRLYAYMIPVFAVAAFGIVSVLIITYRVATFNNCDEAYRELVSEIEEAKADLAKKGFKRE